MKLKTYFATSVEAAMLMALEQLGPDAMIVNSRKCAPENRHLGEYEVVFTDAPQTPVISQSSIQEGSANPPQGGELATDSVNRLHEEVSRLALEIESLGRAMKRSQVNEAVSNFNAETADLAHSLTEAGFSDGFVLELISGSVPEGGSLRFRVLQLMVERLKAAPSLGLTGHGRKVVALIGPSGAGKSTLIAKLAARFGVTARRSCHIISLDSDRIGSSEPLRMVSGVLGVGFRLIDDSSMLAGALESARDRDLVLIDTPGFASDEWEDVSRLQIALNSRQEVDVHLVLPASMKLRDLDRTTRLYRALGPAKLIFTRLDETDQIGTAIEAAIASNLPISFVSNGPRIPEDLELANVSQLARRAFLTMAGGFTRRAAA